MRILPEGGEILYQKGNNIRRNYDSTENEKTKVKKGADKGYPSSSSTTLRSSLRFERAKKTGRPSVALRAMEGRPYFAALRRANYGFGKNFDL